MANRAAEVRPDDAGVDAIAALVGLAAELPLGPTLADGPSSAITEGMRAATLDALRRIEAVIACRQAMDRNVAPLLAVEAMTMSLRAG